MDDDVRRELALRARRRPRRVPRGLWVALAHLPRRRGQRRRRPGQRPSCSTPSSSRSTGMNVMIGHGVACYGSGDRYLGMLAATLGDSARRRAPLRGGARAEPAHGCGDVARAHRTSSTGARCVRDGEPERAGAHARRGGRARRPARPDARSRRASRASARRSSARSVRASRSASSRSSGSSPGGSPTARSAPSSTSASTRPRTTSAASCARPAARTGPRRPRSPTSTGW